jgi:hypothetical protein
MDVTWHYFQGKKIVKFPYQAEIVLLALRIIAKLPNIFRGSLIRGRYLLMHFSYAGQILCFSAFQCHWQKFTKTSDRQNSGDFYPAILDESTLVPNCTENVCHVHIGKYLLTLPYAQAKFTLFILNCNWLFVTCQEHVSAIRIFKISNFH